MFHYPDNDQVQELNQMHSLNLRGPGGPLSVTKFTTASSSMHIHFTDGAVVSLTRCSILHGGREEFQVGAKN